MAAKKPIRMTLEPQAKEVVVEIQGKMQRLSLGSGVYCPCCAQLVKIYEREITGSMAYVAILIHRHFLHNNGEGWLHVPEYLSNMSVIGAAVRGGDWAKLRYWKVIEEKPEEKRKDGSPRVGFYRITPTGISFVKGEIKVPRSILIYNDKFIRYGKGTVSIHDCLGKKFDYAALMAGNVGTLAV
jgi:hypothetical protein